MHIYLDCIPCFIRQSLDAARHATSDVQKHKLVMQEVIRLTNELDMSLTPPEIGQKVHRLVREQLKNNDPYHVVKRQFNNTALKLYSGMRQKIIESPFPLETAIRIAIGGNIIDSGVNNMLEESDVEQTINSCLEDSHVDMHLEEFKKAVDEAGEILYLADNAGEIIFDRLLIEQLPIDKVIVAVKGSPVINDATRVDAVIAGLPQIVEVIDNGSDAPGTILNSCSDEFRHYYDRADLIISKGQGNYETLSDKDKNIFFILKVKCPVIAFDLGCENGEMILQRSCSFQGHPTRL